VVMRRTPGTGGVPVNETLPEMEPVAAASTFFVGALGASDAGGADEPPQATVPRAAASRLHASKCEERIDMKKQRESPAETARPSALYRI
jgi:hypothetical protein